MHVDIGQDNGILQSKQCKQTSTLQFQWAHLHQGHLAVPGCHGSSWLGPRPSWRCQWKPPAQISDKVHLLDKNPTWFTFTKNIWQGSLSWQIFCMVHFQHKHLIRFTFMTNIQQVSLLWSTSNKVLFHGRHPTMFTFIIKSNMVHFYGKHSTWFTFMTTLHMVHFHLQSSSLPMKLTFKHAGTPQHSDKKKMHSFL